MTLPTLVCINRDSMVTHSSYVLSQRQIYPVWMMKKLLESGIRVPDKKNKSMEGLHSLEIIPPNTHHSDPLVRHGRK